MFSIYEEIPFSVKPTYIYTVRSALIGAISAGVGSLLGNIAVSILQASQWDLALMTSLEGTGMLLAFFWGSVAAGRPKMPFVFWPGIICGSFFFFLGWINLPTVFCALVGVMGLIGNVGAPAKAGIVSSNMPSRLRGRISGFVQRWAILIVVIVGIAGAELIQGASWIYRWILPIGGVFGIASAIVYRRIKVRGERNSAAEQQVSDSSFFAAFRVLGRDKLFRTYMIDFFLFGFANLLTLPITLIVLRDDMNADFRQIQWTNIIIPATTGLLTVGFWGRVLDRANPVVMRAWMNLVWIALPLCYYFAPRHPVSFAGFTMSPVHFIWIGTFVQGSIAAGQGLIWMLGATYFARKADVPLYQGVHIGLTGLRALIGAYVGPLMVEHLFGGGMEARRSLYLVSIMMMLISAFLLFKLAGRIKREFGGKLPSEIEEISLRESHSQRKRSGHHAGEGHHRGTVKPPGVSHPE